MNKVYPKADSPIGAQLSLKGLKFKALTTQNWWRESILLRQTAFSPSLSLSRVFVHSVLVTDYNIPVMSGLL